MTLKYESELLFDLMKRDGDDAPSDVLPYETELKEKYLNQVIGAYPKLQDYRAEWLNYNLYHHIPSEFPVESIANVTSASFDNVVPYAYKSAILKGSTKFRDIDTGEVLDAFEDGRNLELVSVKMPVLFTHSDGNLLNVETLIEGGYWGSNGVVSSHNNSLYSEEYLFVKHYEKIKVNKGNVQVLEYDENKNFIKRVQLPTDGVYTINEDVCFVRISFYNLGLAKEIMVSVGDSRVPFTDDVIKTNILSTSEDVVLHKVRDVQDELDLLTGELTERIKKFDFLATDDGNWYYHKNENGYTSYYMSNQALTYKKLGICDKLPICNWTGDAENMNKECVWFNGETSWGVMIKSDKASTKQEFLNYLNDNVELLLISKTESIKTVDLIVTEQDGNTKSNIRPIEGTMYVNTSSQTLPPLLDMSVPVEATSQNLMSFANIEEEE